MRLSIWAQSMRVDPGLRNSVDRRLIFSLGRFSARILRIAVRLIDINGPRGGADKRCTLLLRLAHGGQLVTHATDSDLRVAIDAAVSKAARALAHRVGRMEASAQHGHARGRRGIRIPLAQIRRFT